MSKAPATWSWRSNTDTELDDEDDRAPYVLGYINLPPPLPQSAPAHDVPIEAQATSDELSDVMFKLKLAEEAAREREAALARAGEFEWVRAGGSLRDSKGRIDRKRTEEVRAKVEQARAVERAWELWDAYEERWRQLLPGRGELGASALGVSVAGTFLESDLTWDDIPWPTEENTIDWMEREKIRREKERRPSGFLIPKTKNGAALPMATSNKPLPAPAPGQPAVQVTVTNRGRGNLSPETISSFLLSSVTTLPSNSDSSSIATVSDKMSELSSLSGRKPVTASHRIKRELLHWHPDKFNVFVLYRVRETEQERVKDGVDLVFRWLNEQAPRGRTAMRGGGR